MEPRIVVALFIIAMLLAGCIGSLLLYRRRHRNREDVRIWLGTADTPRQDNEKRVFIRNE
jgi:hypothetical protein